METDVEEGVGGGWCVSVCVGVERRGVKAGNECDLEKVAQRGKGEMIVAAVEPMEKKEEREPES